MTRTFKELGLEAGSQWQMSPPCKFAKSHIDQISSDLPSAAPLVQVLEQVGLVALGTHGGGTFGGGGSVAVHQLTNFGQSLLDRIRAIDAALQAR